MKKPAGIDRRVLYWSIGALLLDHRDELASLDLLSFLDADLFDLAFCCGYDVRLHLHGLDNSDRVTFFDLIALTYEHLYDVARDVGSDLVRIILVRDTCGLSLHVSVADVDILDLDDSSVAVDFEVEFSHAFIIR